ncbi:dehydrogenase with different specificitie [Aspergillus caelatus]|uniref:Dehydrogenase with different specificitie n=1 Tax=Aspergillus caelatus TaxID=61420 RepID=A0A5N7A110_9EURO|nr:dehydrogenase with different specificitie [Aspergillus caelatus]KAE8362190.1 dehydrogenase with different specificitie [Aspergillus caelatus]
MRVLGKSDVTVSRSSLGTADLLPKNHLWNQIHEKSKDDMQELGPGDARPTALQIIKDAGREGGLVGKVILITGCSSGLGIETARALVHTGVTLYLTARDLDKPKSSLGNIVESPQVYLLHLGLNSMASVCTCAEEFQSRSYTLNILIANAADRFEIQFGTNYLAYFLLFYLFRHCLLSLSTPAFNSRVVIVASSVHRISSVHFDNLSLEGEYELWKAYSQITELLRHVSEEQKADWEKNKFLINYWKSTEQGAVTTVWGAVARELEGIGGKYLDNYQIALPADPAQRHGPGYAVWAYSPEMEKRLWAISLDLLNEY